MRTDYVSGRSQMGSRRRAGCPAHPMVEPLEPGWSGKWIPRRIRCGGGQFAQIELVVLETEEGAMKKSLRLLFLLAIGGGLNSAEAQLLPIRVGYTALAG